MEREICLFCSTRKERKKKNKNLLRSLWKKLFFFFNQEMAEKVLPSEKELEVELVEKIEKRGLTKADFGF